jgi:uncharacterized RDD family membrane protein YckC
MNGLAPAHAVPLTGPSLDNRRVAAAAIDLVVIGAFGLLLTLVGGGRTAGTTVVLVGWALYYYFALESLTGQTLGKRVMSLKVVRSDGGDPDMRTIAVRTVLRLVDGIGAYLVGLIVMLVTGERRQRLGDLAAGTIVTTAEEDAAESEAPVVPLHQPEEAPASPPAPAPPPPVEKEPPPFEPYTVPEPPAPAPEPVEPPPPAAAEPRIELVPDPPAEGEQRRIQIVSPMDVVMGEDEPPSPPRSA